MAYLSKTLDNNAGTFAISGVLELFNYTGWRIWVICRLLYGCVKIICAVPFFLLWLPNKLVWSALLLWKYVHARLSARRRRSRDPLGEDEPRHAQAVHGEMPSFRRAIYESILKLAFHITSNNTHLCFWFVYFCITPNLDDFVEDYCEALRGRYKSLARAEETRHEELVLFVDNGFPLQVPCHPTENDYGIVGSLRLFYELTLARKGFIQLISLKTPVRIDIARIEHDTALGPREGPPLNLGREGSSNRQVHFFQNRSRVKKMDLQTRLRHERVLTHPYEQERALNIVRGWSSQAAGIAVALPALLSLIISIAWSMVATLRYHADAQASVQTGFTIGSYVVTTGALLIALVAFLDTKYASTEQYLETPRPRSQRHAARSSSSGSNSPSSEIDPRRIFMQPIQLSTLELSQTAYPAFQSPQQQQTARSQDRIALSSPHEAAVETLGSQSIHTRSSTASFHHTPYDPYQLQEQQEATRSHDQVSLPSSHQVATQPPPQVNSSPTQRQSSQTYWQTAEQPSRIQNTQPDPSPNFTQSGSSPT